jgi:hypothetical protein
MELSFRIWSMTIHPAPDGDGFAAQSNLWRQMSTIVFDIDADLFDEGLV